MAGSLTRRRFLASTAGAAALGATAGSWTETLWSAPPVAIELPRQPPYEKLRPLVEPGADEFACEAEAREVHERLSRLLEDRSLPLADDFTGPSPAASRWTPLGQDAEAAEFTTATRDFATGVGAWIEELGEVRAARFFPLEDNRVRFEIASRTADGALEYRVGHWRMEWADGRLRRFQPLDETRTRAVEPLFRDVTATLFGDVASVREQLAVGVPAWRSRLDLAAGIDLYGQQGIAVGDIDGDGRDEIYVCQPGGLPNRLYSRGDDGRWRDVTREAGVDLLDYTSAALFADFRNAGVQDLVVLASAGPLYFENDGAGKFELREDAFRFARPAQGAYTGLAAADYDGDGRLDLYLCCYIYYQSEDQYSYPSPYHDSRNGPPNFLFRNRLDEGFFEDVTAAVGLDENNDRYSFAPAWRPADGDGRPELYVANDFGRNNLYRFDGERFRDVAAEAGVEDLGPGMSAAWLDFDGDSRPDLYVTNMWSAAGRRVIHDPEFAPVAEHGLKEEYRRHTKGNSLYRNRGEAFEETGEAEMGRWSWMGDGYDFDGDGRPELLVAAGMTTQPDSPHPDLMSFFWRQVVAKTSLDAEASTAYQEGWNALNQFAREDYSWNGDEPNVFYARRGERYVDFSGVSGLDRALDSRSFAVCDLDGDGRPDLLLRNRLGPQLQAFQNACAAGEWLVLTLEGATVNRDAVGAWVTIEHAGGLSSQGLSAGSGYLAQHTKRLMFRVDGAARATVRWPGAETEEIDGLGAGRAYRIRQGEGVVDEASLAAPRALEAAPLEADNDASRRDAWLLEPVPLPEQQSGPGFVEVRGGETPRSAWYAIFARYLYDYRAWPEFPFTLLVDADSRARKIYFRAPDEATRERDLKALDEREPAESALPFPGWYKEPTSRSYFRHGAAFYQAGFTDQAIPYLEAVLEKDPKNFKTLLALGQIHLEAERLDEAERRLEAARALNPQSASLENNLGGLAMSRERYAEAAAHFERALELEPDVAYALANLGQAYARLGRSGEAEKTLRRALELDPADADAADRLGLLLAKQGRLAEAKPLFQQAIEVERGHASAINNLAVVYLQENRPREAVAALRYGIERAPDSEQLHLNLARLYVQSGDRLRARDLLEEFLARRPDSEVARRALRELTLQ